MNEQILSYSDKYYKEEKIDGKIYRMAAPCDEHIDVQSNLLTIFNNYFKQNKKNCRARHDSRLDINEDNYLEPDLKILCRENNNGEIPVIVIEILSKSTRKRDLGVKMKKYAELGIKEYWIVTWELSSIVIYLLNDNKQYDFYKSYAYYSSEDELKRLDEDELKEAVTEFSPVLFPDIIIRLEDVFDIF